MQGMMKDGKREGLWKSFYENGNQWSESFYVNVLESTGVVSTFTSSTGFSTG